MKEIMKRKEWEGEKLSKKSEGKQRNKRETGKLIKETN